MPFFGPTRAALAAAAARGADIIPSLRLVLTAEALTAPPPAHALEQSGQSGGQLRHAARSAQSGDTAQLEQMMCALGASPEGAKLMEQLQKMLGK